MTDARAAGAAVRISDARLDDTAGVDRQEADCRELAKRRGWTITEVYVENDTSAFKRRRVELPDGTTALRVDRPAFRKLLADLAAGVITALVVYDLDRIARDPRDLEDLIDVVEQHKVPTAAVTGSLDLSTDAGITMARIMVAVANKSSRDTGRRVSRKQLEMAEQGIPSGGGIRTFGYDRTGMRVVETEAEIVREMARRIIEDGDTLTGLARDLTARGVPTVQGAPIWSSRSVHSAVTKARNAGLREHKGEIIGKAVWPAILDQDVWEEVRAVLADRSAGHSVKLQRWLNSVLICSNCRRPLVGGTGPRKTHRYWCHTWKGGCGKIAITAQDTEQLVTDMILGYVKRPDVLADLHRQTSQQSTKQARKDAAADEAQLAELAQMWGQRTITTPEYFAARKPVEERLRTAKAILAVGVPGGVRKLLAAKNTTDGWNTLTPPERRDVARVVFPSGIEVKPGAKGEFRYQGERLDPIDWR